LRFKKLKGDASTVAKAQNGAVKEREESLPIDSVTPRSEFTYDGAVYSVKSVENGTAKCKLTFDDSESMIVTLKSWSCQLNR
jgi:hypothetical protein